MSYGYDLLGRLITANTIGSSAYPAWGLSETYDRYGNRTNQSVTAGSGYSSSLSIDPTTNRIIGDTYDAAGHVLNEPAPLSTGYGYSAEECLTNYTGNGSSAVYHCDGNHLRTTKVVTGNNPVTTWFIRSGGQVIAEYDNGAAVNSPTREYIFGNSRIATIVGSVAGSGGTITYEHRDQASPRLFTDVNGNDIGEQGTYPFGESWYNNSGTSRWVYTTYERDQESGQDYAAARTYSSGTGRFMSPDPLEGQVGDPQSWNRYIYVENDPVNLTDPSGQGFWTDLFFAIADVFVAIFDAPALPGVLSVEGQEQAGELVTMSPCTFPCIQMGAGRDSSVKVVAAPCPPNYCGGNGNGTPGGDSGTGSDSTGTSGNRAGGGNPSSQGPTGGGVAGTDPSPGALAI